MGSRTTATTVLWLCVLWATCGCARWNWNSTPQLPSRHNLVLDQLVIFSDSALPQHHRLLEELRTQRSVVSTKLSLPVSDEPIHVYLFPTAERLESYLHVHYPTLPNRRAFFVESDTRLTVYAYWGDRVAEDLRHEVAHGYLHAVVPGLPLWLDEGLAEYFEVPRGMSGLNRPHLEQLTSPGQPAWTPDLKRLEALGGTGQMTQADYAESWAWVHFLLESSPERQDLLRRYLHALGKSPRREPLSEALQRTDPDYARHLLEHLALQRQALQ
jgi:hypothetical protein